MSISAKDVMTLRQKTGLGMMECKKALEETSGDLAAAEEHLRTQLKGKMDKRTERPAAEGRLAIKVAGDHSAAAMIEINTETDFTARNESVAAVADTIAGLALEQGSGGQVEKTDAITRHVDDIRISTSENASFRRGWKFTGGYCGGYLHHNAQVGVILQTTGPVDEETMTGICQHIAFADPAGVDAGDIPQSEIDKVKAEAKQQAMDEGKPEEIAEKMVDGKVRKHLAEITLLNQKYVKDTTGKAAVRDILPAGVTVTAFKRFVVGLGGDEA